MKVALNGTERQLPDGATVLDAVATAAGDPDRGGIAVAVEGDVVPRRRWSEVVLAEGQRVEVLEARQGG